MIESIQYGEDEVSFHQYFAMFRRRRWVILGAILASLAVGAMSIALTRPIYEARAALLVRTSAPIVNSFTDNPLADVLEMGQPEPLPTQLAILQSERFLREVFVAARTPRQVPAQVSAKGDPETNIVTISVQSSDPAVAARVANTVVDEYLERTRVLSLQELTRARAFVRKETERARQALQRAEDALLSYHRASGDTKLTAGSTNREQELIQLEAQSRQAQNDAIRVRAQMISVRSQLAQQPGERILTLIQDNPRATALQAKLAEATAERDSVLQSYRPGSLKVRALDSNIAGLRAQLASEPVELRVPRHEPNARHEQLLALLDGYQAELEGLRAQQAQLEVQLREQRERMKRVAPGSAEVRLTQLQRDREMAEKMYLMLANKLQDLQIRENMRRNTARVFQRASPPRAPVQPRSVQHLALSLGLGVLLGCCLAFLLEYLDDRITSPEEVDRLLGLPVLAYIPAITSDRRLMHALPPYSPAAESYRGLRAGIDFSAMDAPVATLAVSSARAGEGKSLTAINLAIAMAVDGRSVILVDADLRWPSLHRLLGLQPSPGLSEVITGQCGLQEALQPVPEHQLLVLTGGSIPRNPAEMLNTAAMQNIIRQLSEQTDIVIFDTPPCVPFTDAQVLATKLDGMLLVTALGEARKAELQRARQLIDQARIRVLGVVFNKIRDDHGSSYLRYSYYRSHYYGISSQREGGNHSEQVLPQEVTGRAREESTTAEVTAAHLDREQGTRSCDT
jgi:succinoglycan biosynthesis transport protein ExoP